MEYVYILQEIDFDGTPTGHYKIGKTKAGTEARKRQYQAGNPRFLDPFHTVEVTNSQTVETDLHHRFDSYRLKGYGGGDEWFNFHSVDMEKFVSIMNEYNETPAYVPPEPVYYQQSYSSPDFELSGLLTNPILGFVLLLVFLLVVVGGSLKPVNLGNQPSVKRKLGGVSVPVLILMVVAGQLMQVPRVIKPLTCGLPPIRTAS